ncbi:uncharacterized protein [Tenebrio molitor]|uniref:uncharacterized protein n=1 Tax=Tenebrio molitor TaxID=7067 RepID=UPI0036247C0B
MNLLLVPVLLILTANIEAYTVEQLEKIGKLSDECSLETGSTMDMILHIRHGIYVDDPIMKEHVLCFGRKIGVIDDNDVIDEDYIRDVVRAAAEKVADNCLIDGGGSPQDRVYRLAICLKYNIPMFLSSL